MNYSAYGVRNCRQQARSQFSARIHYLQPTGVVEAANVLKVEGIKPTVRLVHARTRRGSHSTLSEYLQRWREESALAVTVEDGILETLKQAFLAEFGRQVKPPVRDWRSNWRKHNSRLKK